MRLAQTATGRILDKGTEILAETLSEKKKVLSGIRFASDRRRRADSGPERSNSGDCPKLVIISSSNQTKGSPSRAYVIECASFIRIEAAAADVLILDI